MTLFCEPLLQLLAGRLEFLYPGFNLAQPQLLHTSDDEPTNKDRSIALCVSVSLPPSLPFFISLSAFLHLPVSLFLCPTTFQISNFSEKEDPPSIQCIYKTLLLLKVDLTLQQRLLKAWNDKQRKDRRLHDDHQNLERNNDFLCSIAQWVNYIAHNNMFTGNEALRREVMVDSEQW